jgi:Protein of unknown function (DUF4199)
MEEQRAPSIAKIATKYGVIQGVLAFVIFVAGAMTGIGIKQGSVWSLVSLAVGIVLMVLMHREFKKTHDGMMTYSQGLGSGTLLALVGAVVSSILGYFYVRYINGGYFAAVMEFQKANLQQHGITGAQAEQAMTLTSMIASPVGLLIQQLIVGVIVGFILALIVSIFTQKRDPRAVV